MIMMINKNNTFDIENYNCPIPKENTMCGSHLIIHKCSNNEIIFNNIKFNLNQKYPKLSSILTNKKQTLIVLSIINKKTTNHENNQKINHWILCIYRNSKIEYYELDSSETTPECDYSLCYFIKLLIDSNKMLSIESPIFYRKLTFNIQNKYVILYKNKPGKINYYDCPMILKMNYISLDLKWFIKNSYKVISSHKKEKQLRIIFDQMISPLTRLLHLYHNDVCTNFVDCALYEMTEIIDQLISDTKQTEKTMSEFCKIAFDENNNIFNKSKYEIINTNKTWNGLFQELQGKKDEQVKTIIFKENLIGLKGYGFNKPLNELKIEQLFMLIRSLFKEHAEGTILINEENEKTKFTQSDKEEYVPNNSEIITITSSNLEHDIGADTYNPYDDEPEIQSIKLSFESINQNVNQKKEPQKISLGISIEMLYRFTQFAYAVFISEITNNTHTTRITTEQRDTANVTIDRDCHFCDSIFIKNFIAK